MIIIIKLITKIHIMQVPLCRFLADGWQTLHGQNMTQLGIGASGFCFSHGTQRIFLLGCLLLPAPRMITLV